MARKCRELIKNRELNADPRKANDGSFSKTLYGNNSKELSILMLDDPEHKRQRTLVLQAFNKRSVDALLPRIEQISRNLLDDIAATPTASLILCSFSGRPCRPR